MVANVVRQEIADRTCDVCNTGEIEDELHFLCGCPLYDELRTNLFDKAGESCNNFNLFNDNEKFVFLLNELWWEVARFIKLAWYLRRDKLYK